MRLWRISNFANLSGQGGSLFASRWNDKGFATVYCADHPSTALLETLVHYRSQNIPDTYQLMSIEVPDELRILSADLPEKWQNSMEATRRIGTRFITDQTVPLLRIPSIVMPQASNYLLNPNHPDAASIRIVETWRYPFDSRLLS